MNNRGNIFDAFTIVYMLFAVAIILVVGIIFVSKLSDAFDNDTIPDRAKGMASDVDGQAGWVFDFLLLMLLVCLPLGSMILAFFNDIPPLLFWASIGVSMLVIILGSAFGDAWVTMVSDGGELGLAASRMPMTSTVFNHFGVYAFFAVLLIIAGVFVKSKSNVGYY